ncbi:MAG: response regulator transcription factor [Opitutaceae bacterium]
MPETKIVIVEDHTLVRDLLRDVIALQPNLKVVGLAGTVKEGIAICLKLQPDLLVADWMLPDGTGLELIRSIRYRLPNMRILMLTANEQEGIVKDAATMGVQGFVTKRQTMPVLRDAILSVAAGNLYYCPTSSRILLDALKDEKESPSSPLTAREWEVLRAIACGLSTKEMAKKLNLSPKTVANHLTGLKEKLGIQEPAGLVLYAIKHGLVELQ